MTTPALVKQSELKRMEVEIAAGKFGTIYFVTNPESETVKIGFTTSLSRRMEVLQTGNHVSLLAYSGFRSVPQVERIIHRIFKAERIKNEWFRHTDELDQFIECFEEFQDENEVDAIGTDDLKAVLDDWSNSYGRGASA